MSSDRAGRAIEFLMASPRQLDEVLAVLDEAAAWLRGREALRLDCVASNGRLGAYYEAAGLVSCGDVTVAGAPGQRLEEGPVTVVSRYELRLAVTV